MDTKLDQPQSAARAPPLNSGTRRSTTRAAAAHRQGARHPVRRPDARLRPPVPTAWKSGSCRERRSSGRRPPPAHGTRAVRQREAASLAERIKTGSDERTDATKDLSASCASRAKAFEKKASVLDDQIRTRPARLRQQILELHQQMTDDLRQKIDDVLARLGRESAELRHDKTDRATLAALLTEMAMRLNNELTIPGLDDGRRG